MTGRSGLIKAWAQSSGSTCQTAFGCRALSDLGSMASMAGAPRPWEKSEPFVYKMLWDFTGMVGAGPKLSSGSATWEIAL